MTLAGASRARRPGVIPAALLVTLATPGSWPIGLAGFLAGGGLLVVAWPFLSLPSMTAIQNALGGPVSSLAFGSVSPTLVLAIAALVAGAIAVLLGGTWLGAWAERAGVVAALDAALDEDLSPGASSAAEGREAMPGVSRVVLVRLLSLVPLVAVVAASFPSIYAAVYRELLVPGDVAVPVEVRVVRTMPGVAVGLLAAWLVTDSAAALGVRRLLLDGRSVPSAVLAGWVDLLRRPHRAVVTALAGLALPAMFVVAGLAASAAAWDRARDALVSGLDGLAALLPLLLWIATWLGALVLAGAGSAFRSAAFTFEARGGSGRRS